MQQRDDTLMVVLGFVVVFVVVTTIYSIRKFVSEKIHSTYDSSDDVSCNEIVLQQDAPETELQLARARQHRQLCYLHSQAMMRAVRTIHQTDEENSFLQLLPPEIIENILYLYIRANHRGKKNKT